MVKIEELRRGNIIRLKSSNDLIKIDGYYSDFIGYPDPVKLKWFSFTQFDPVDFTQGNILEKCGFNQIKEGYMWKNNQVHLMIDDNKFCLGDKDSTDMYSYPAFETYLHLLQNVFYFLRGEELPIDKIL